MSLIVEVQAYKIKGEVNCMASKSMLQRAIIIAYLAKGKSHIKNAQLSADSATLLKAIESLGSIVSKSENQLFINPQNVFDKAASVNIGESGLAFRILSSILGLNGSEYIIEGSGSILKRPLEPVIKTLSSFGISISDFWPVKIKGPIKAGNYKIDGSFSSQILSGLLIALPLCQANSEITVDNLKSKPYIDMTISVMAAFGVECTHDNYEKFIIKGNQSYQGSEYTIEGDWSAAANLLTAAAISGSITIGGLQTNSRQADKKILEALELYGAKIIVHDSNKISVQENNKNPFVFDATDCPDLFPPLVVLAASCQGESRIKGVHRLIHKESNRLESLKDIFSRLGLKIHSENDELIINGTGELLGGHIDSHNDHRIAMAGAIAGTIASASIYIKNFQAVNKSYPKFFEDLETIKV